MKLTSKKAKIYGVILGIVLFALLAIGVTYAFITWTSKTSKISIVTECMNTNYTNGEITVPDNLLIFNEKEIFNSGQIILKEGMALTSMSFNKETKCNLDVVLSLDLYINDLPNDYTNNSKGALKYVIAEYNAEEYPNATFDELKNNSFSIIKKGTIESTDDIEIYAETLPSDGTSRNFLVIFYIDGSKAKNAIADTELSMSMEATAVQSVTTPITDFIYETEEWDARNDGSVVVEIPEGTVLLKQYTGTSSVVNIPSVYTIDGIEYTPIVYGDGPNGQATFMYNDIIKEVNFSSGVLFSDFNNEETLIFDSISSLFSGCESLLKVTGIPDSIINMEYSFFGCTSVVTAPVIPNSVEYMDGAFLDCTSLINAPVIPNSVKYMVTTFAGCTSLINAPEIPNSVIDMSNTFSGCTSLINIPEVPNSVKNMNGTFKNCISLLNVPQIPDSVTNMAQTFLGCTNLTGIIRINSSGVQLFNNITNHAFYNTGKAITVEVPAGSTTYNSLNTYKPVNVTIITY